MPLGFDPTATCSRLWWAVTLLASLLSRLSGRPGISPCLDIRLRPFGRTLVRFAPVLYASVGRRSGDNDDFDVRQTTRAARASVPRPGVRTAAAGHGLAGLAPRPTWLFPALAAGASATAAAASTSGRTTVAERDLVDRVAGWSINAVNNSAGTVAAAIPADLAARADRRTGVSGTLCRWIRRCRIRCKCTPHCSFVCLIMSGP